MEKKLGTIENPIRCEGPMGERSYLDQLISQTRGFLNYRRGGSLRTNGNTLDVYHLFDLSGEKVTELFFDMYHEGFTESDVPEGLVRIDQEELNRQVMKKTLSASFSEKAKEIRARFDIDESSHGYVMAKAQRLILCGPIYYQSHDHFGHPQRTWDLKGIVDASRQIAEDFAGRIQDHPIQVLSIEVADQLLKTFHFDAVNLESLESTEDPVLITAAHHVTQMPLRFWFKYNR